jgi:hypothetical protein
VYLRQDDVLGVGLALLGDGVHEGLGGEAGCLGGCQALGHTVHIHILGKCFLRIQDCMTLYNNGHDGCDACIIRQWARTCRSYCVKSRSVMCKSMQGGAFELETELKTELAS